MVKVTGGLKRNGQDYKPGSGRGRRKLSTVIARQLVTGALRPFTNLGPGQGPSMPAAQAHKAQGSGQHKQEGAEAGGLAFDEVNKRKGQRKRKAEGQ